MGAGDEVQDGRRELKLESEADLTCSACGVEGPHELLYLSEHLRASRCANCGKIHRFAGSIYAEYARDLAERTTRLPYRFVRQTLGHPLTIFGLPAKVLRKPFGLLREVGQVSAFERRRSAWRLRP